MVCTSQRSKSIVKCWPISLFTIRKRSARSPRRRKQASAKADLNRERRAAVGVSLLSGAPLLLGTPMQALHELVQRAKSEIETAASLQALDAVRGTWLGKQGSLTEKIG